MPIALFHVMVASVIRSRFSNLAHLQAQMLTCAPSGNSGQNDIIFDCLAIRCVKRHSSHVYVRAPTR